MPMTLVAVGTGAVTLYNNSDISHNQNSNNITHSRVIDSYNISASSQVPAAFEENLADASFKDERRRNNRQAPAHDHSALDPFEREEEYDDEPLWQVPDHPFYSCTTQPSSSQPVPEAFMSSNSWRPRVNSENFYPETELQSPQQFTAQVRSPDPWNPESSHPGHSSSSHPFTPPNHRQRAPGGSRNIRHEVEATYDEHERRRRRSVGRGRPAARNAREKARGSGKGDANKASTLNQIPQLPLHPVEAHSRGAPHFPSISPYYNPNGASSPVPCMHHWAPSAPLNPRATMIPAHYQPQPSPAYLTTTYTIIQPVPTNPTFISPESQLYSPTPRPIVQPVPFSPSFISSESRLHSPVLGSASFIQPPPEPHYASYHHSPNPFTPSRDIYYNTHPHMGTTTLATAHYQTAPSPDYFPSGDLPSHALPRSGWLHEGRPGMIMSDTETESYEVISPTSRERLKRETAQRVSHADMLEPVSKRSRRR